MSIVVTLNSELESTSKPPSKRYALYLYSRLGKSPSSITNGSSCELILLISILVEPSRLSCITPLSKAFVVFILIKASVQEVSSTARIIGDIYRGRSGGVTRSRQEMKINNMKSNMG